MTLLDQSVANGFDVLYQNDVCLDKHVIIRLIGQLVAAFTVEI